jgi:peptidoglycan/xylan/chitin deacetylase (PgdA/CDA1 family)
MHEVWNARRQHAKIHTGYDLNYLPMIGAVGVTGAAGFAAWGAVAASAQLYGPTLRHTSSAKKLALTFDDGPNPSVTPRLLDLFDRYSVHATFFVVGKFVRNSPDLVREISARGHLLGNHTDTHPNLIFQSRGQIHEELTRCQESVANVLRADPPQWMRPPFGYRRPGLDAEVHRSGLHGVVMWSLICHDWKPQPSARLIGKLSRAARPGGSRGNIVVLHDGDYRALGANRDHLVAALEHWLPRWRDAGVEFVTIDSFEANPDSSVG